MRIQGICMVVAAIWLVGAGSAVGQMFNVDQTLAAREPEAMLAELPDAMRERVWGRWSAAIRDASGLTSSREHRALYPNPTVQTYINSFGLRLVPHSASGEIYLTFRVVNDPLPYADALSTGVVYLSTGLLALMENESQLAFLLMHEAAHVVLSHELAQIIEEERAEKKERRIRRFGAIAGGVVGGLIGGQTGMEVAVGSFAASSIGAEVYGRFRNRRFSLSLQREADHFAAEALLRHAFDARQAPRLLARVGEMIRVSGPAVGLAFSSGADLPKRRLWIDEMLTGRYQQAIDYILSEQGFQMSSPRFSEMIAVLKRDNGLLALKADLFAMARNNLEESAAIRTDDPVTMYGLGRLFQMTARTEEDRGKATSFLRRAMDFDELRHRYPEVHLYLAVHLIGQEDPSFFPDIQKSLKSYVTLFQRRMGGQLPPELPFVYDWLSRTGENEWVAYHVLNVSSGPPYQLTGEPELDQMPTALVVATTSGRVEAADDP